MEKKEKLTVYMPQRLYAEVFERQLAHHFSHLVSLLVEGFIRATDIRISWMEMPSKVDQKAYLERKVFEFLSRLGVPMETLQQTGMPSESPPVQNPKPTHIEPPKTFVQKKEENYAEPSRPTHIEPPKVVAEPFKPTYAEPPSPPVQEKIGHTYVEPPRPSVQEQRKDNSSFSEEDRWWESLW